jgi:1,4-dihydroxy-2-naphthoyl-CoA hydrolase
MAFSFTRTIRFSDTDAAGVVYFANILSICHEAYEDSLINFGMDVKVFFGRSGVAFPIVRANIDFQRPMYCGDKIVVILTPQILDESSFEIAYDIAFESDKTTLAQASTRHVCIDATARKKQPLTTEAIAWINWIDR